MNTTTTNDLIFTNKHASRTHKCTAGQVDITMAEILTFYRGEYGEQHREQISHTPLMVLAQNMTDEQIHAAKFSDEELALFHKGGEVAVTARRQRIASEALADPELPTTDQMQAMADWSTNKK